MWFWPQLVFWQSRRYMFGHHTPARYEFCTCAKKALQDVLCNSKKDSPTHLHLRDVLCIPRLCMCSTIHCTKSEMEVHMTDRPFPARLTAHMAKGKPKMDCPPDSRASIIHIGTSVRMSYSLSFTARRAGLLPSNAPYKMIDSRLRSIMPMWPSLRAHLDLASARVMPAESVNTCSPSRSALGDLSSEKT